MTLAQLQISQMTLTFCLAVMTSFHTFATLYFAKLIYIWLLQLCFISRNCNFLAEGE